MCFTETHINKLRAYLLKQVLEDFRTEGNPIHKPAFTQLVLYIGEDNKPGGNTEQPRRATAKPGKGTWTGTYKTWKASGKGEYKVCHVTHVF